VIPAALPALADDAAWTHPQLVELADPHLRADLAELARRLPAIIEHLAGLPQVLSHGDASPQNLLVPADDSDTFVVIDWTMSGLIAVGDDLSQLLVGVAHDGELAVDQQPSLRDVLARQYTAGLAAEGFMLDERHVRDGIWTAASLSAEGVAIAQGTMAETARDAAAVLAELAAATADEAGGEGSGAQSRTR